MGGVELIGSTSDLQENDKLWKFDILGDLFQ